MIGRRAFLAGAGAALASRRSSAEPGAEPLIETARRLAARPFAGASPPLPPPFSALTYDAYRGIRPIPGRGAMLPLGEGWAFDLLPPGLYFPDPVAVEVTGPDGVRDVPFSPARFAFDPRYFADVPEATPGVGFSGLRLRHALDAPDRVDEFLILQGGSYFRAIGRGMTYGLSARAVAIGTGGPAPEEFPRFTRLRLHPPDQDGARVEALIDGPSLAGHMEMRADPGAETVTTLSVTLFPRRRIADIGVAPLTSMYLKGPLRSAVSDDFRPRVHDSDVLAIRNGAGETLWRPLSNPARIETSAFADDGPVSFALHQTPRDFEDFEDPQAHYHTRPSAVVTPRGDWGGGAVVLVEIPTGDEFMDNIVAFWRPDAPLEPGAEYRFDYDVTWTSRPPVRGLPARIVQTRSGRQHDMPGTRRYVVDYAGATADCTPDLSMNGDGAEASGLSFFPLPDGRRRASFLLTPGTAPAVELRLALRNAAGRVAAPVWLHRWTPTRDGGV